MDNLTLVNKVYDLLEWELYLIEIVSSDLHKVVVHLSGSKMVSYLLVNQLKGISPLWELSCTFGLSINGTINRLYFTKTIENHGKDN